jgi:hypothetical protein
MRSGKQPHGNRAAKERELGAAALTPLMRTSCRRTNNARYLDLGYCRALSRCVSVHPSALDAIYAADNVGLTVAVTADDGSIVKYRCRPTRIVDDALVVMRLSSQRAIDRTSAWMSAADCSADYRVIGEVEVEGKIKAN